MRYLFSLILLAALCPGLRAAYIDSVRGNVDLKKAGAAGWTRLEDGEKTRLAAGDELRTARASTADIFMDDGSRVKLAPLSAFKMTAEDKDSVSLGLYFGRVRSWVKKFSKKFEVRTPSAVCAVRGTDFMVSADAEGNSRVEVYEGSVLAGDSRGNSALVREGQFSDIPNGGSMREPGSNPNEPGDMNSAVGDPRQAARAEIYSEISREDVMSRAQEEMQSAEYQMRKTAIDAFGNRVRMEEYTIRPADNQFKYVVLNTRGDRFDFGKILFTFNAALPTDLSQATANMITSPGAAAPAWYLTEMNSVMSNTLDKVTEDAAGGSMVYNGSLTNPAYNLVFNNYSFYAAGPAEANDNGGLGKWLWTKTNYNVGTNTTGGLTYLGQPTAIITDQSSPSGSDVFHTFTKNTYGDGTWIGAQDFVLFDDGDILSLGDFSSGLGAGETVDKVTDRLNFERVYTSSLFGGRTIDVMYSAKLLKDAGLLRFE
jgi:hypothetical protein